MGGKAHDCSETKNMLADVVNNINKFLVATFLPYQRKRYFIFSATNPATHFVKIKQCAAFLISAQENNI